MSSRGVHCLSWTRWTGKAIRYSAIGPVLSWGKAFTDGGQGGGKRNPVYVDSRLAVLRIGAHPPLPHRWPQMARAGQQCKQCVGAGIP